jgi:hypothetical protein
MIVAIYLLANKRGNMKPKGFPLENIYLVLALSAVLSLIFQTQKALLSVQLKLKNNSTQYKILEK